MNDELILQESAQMRIEEAPQPLLRQEALQPMGAPAGGRVQVFGRRVRQRVTMQGVTALTQATRLFVEGALCATRGQIMKNGNSHL